jgi:mono/diheme cytochrome c family protein
MSKAGRFKRLLGWLAGGTVLVGLVAASLAGGREQSAEQLFNRKCAACHGKNGSAKTADGKKYKVKDARENIQKDSEDEMIKVVTNGKGKHMDSFSDELSRDEIKAVVEYYRGLAKK